MFVSYVYLHITVQKVYNFKSDEHEECILLNNNSKKEENKQQLFIFLKMNFHHIFFKH